MTSNSNSTKAPAPGSTPEPEPQRRKSVFTILGWVVFLACLIPFSLMPSGGTSNPEMFAGLGLILCGGVLLAIGHARQNYS